MSDESTSGQQEYLSDESAASGAVVERLSAVAGASGIGALPAAGGLGPGFEGNGSIEPTLPADRPNADAAPIRLRTSLLYSSGNLGAGIFFGFNNFILTLFLAHLGVPIILNNLLGSTRSFEGVFIQPVVGAWSDRTWTARFGRRTIFVLWFTPISALFVVLTPFLAQLTGLGVPFGLSAGTTAIVLVTVGVFLFTLTFNVMYDPYQALLADITPDRQRGGVNGVFQALGAGGQVVILITAITLTNLNSGALPATLLFILTGAFLLIFVLPTIFGIREPRTLPGTLAHHRYTVRDYWAGLRSDPQVLLYFGAQALLWFGINAITPNLSYYAVNSLHFSDAQALILSFILLLTSALFVWPFGILGDRIGLKRTFLLGMLLMAGAALAAVFIRQPIPLYIVLAVAGVGNAAQTASSYPLLTRITLPDRMGLYTGLNGAITSVAAPGGALLSGILITGFGYSVFFPFVAAMFLLALAPLAFLRVERSVAARVLRGELSIPLPEAA